MQNSVGRIFLMMFINQSNIFGLESKFLYNYRSRGRLASPLKTHETICILQILSSPDQNLQPHFICEFFVFYYKSWLLKMPSSQVSFCFMSCSGGRTLSVNQSHSSKRNIHDLPLQLSLLTYRFFRGAGIRGLSFIKMSKD